MLRSLANTYRLGIKEMYSLWHDPVLVVLIIYSFTYAVYGPAKGAALEVFNASIAVVDEDGSQLAKRVREAFLPPYFVPAEPLAVQQIDRAMDRGQYTFVVDLPYRMQRDVLRERRPGIQLNVDATAISQAERGAGYVQDILSQEINTFLDHRDLTQNKSPVNLSIRVKYNPNLTSAWFTGVMQVVNNITMLALFLAGAALIREREHGTIEHLLVMPLRPIEIMLAKVWANGLVIAAVALLSLRFVVAGLLQVPIAGSYALFLSGTAVYLFSVTSMGIYLATLVRSMPQFGLLAFPIFIIMNQLSGGTTPLDSMPPILQDIMLFSPSTHFVSFAQAVLFRGATMGVVWREFAAVAVIGSALFAGALIRFRSTVSALQG